MKSCQTIWYFESLECGSDPLVEKNCHPTIFHLSLFLWKMYVSLQVGLRNSMKISSFPTKPHRFVRIKVGGPHFWSHHPIGLSPNPSAISNQSTVALADSSGLKWGFGSREVKYKLKLSWIRLPSVQIHVRTKRICKNPSKSAQIKLNSAVKQCNGASMWSWQSIVKEPYSKQSWVSELGILVVLPTNERCLWSSIKPKLSASCIVSYQAWVPCSPCSDHWHWCTCSFLGTQENSNECNQWINHLQTFRSHVLRSASLKKKHKIAWLVAAQDHKIPISFEPLHLVFHIP